MNRKKGPSAADVGYKSLLVLACILAAGFASTNAVRLALLAHAARGEYLPLPSTGKRATLPRFFLQKRPAAANQTGCEEFMLLPSPCPVHTPASVVSIRLERPRKAAGPRIWVWSSSTLRAAWLVTAFARALSASLAWCG